MIKVNLLMSVRKLVYTGVKLVLALVYQLLTLIKMVGLIYMLEIILSGVQIQMFGVLFKVKKVIVHLRFMMVFPVDFIEIIEMERSQIKH